MISDIVKFEIRPKWHKVLITNYMFTQFMLGKNIGLNDKQKLFKKCGVYFENKDNLKFVEIYF